MTLFVLLAALLAAGALAFILPPLLGRKGSERVSRTTVNTAIYRDQMAELDSDLRAGTLASGHYDMARRDLEARVLDDLAVPEAPHIMVARRWTPAIAAGLAVPLLAAGIYAFVGSPQALAPGAVTARAPGLNEPLILAMVEGLAARLQENPDDAEGWAMLARSYAVTGRYREAAQAYGNAVARVPADAQLLADYADASAMAQGGELRGEPEKIIVRALEADPDNIKALALAGSVSFETRDFAAAVAHWQRMLRLVPPDSDFARSAAASVAEARALAQSK